MAVLAQGFMVIIMNPDFSGGESVISVQKKPKNALEKKNHFILLVSYRHILTSVGQPTHRFVSASNISLCTVDNETNAE